MRCRGDWRWFRRPVDRARTGTQRKPRRGAGGRRVRLQCQRPQQRRHQFWARPEQGGRLAPLVRRHGAAGGGTGARRRGVRHVPGEVHRRAGDRLRLSSPGPALLCARSSSVRGVVAPARPAEQAVRRRRSHGSSGRAAVGDRLRSLPWPNGGQAFRPAQSGQAGQSAGRAVPAERGASVQRYAGHGNRAARQRIHVGNSARQPAGRYRGRGGQRAGRAVVVRRARKPRRSGRQPHHRDRAIARSDGERAAAEPANRLGWAASARLFPPHPRRPPLPLWQPRVAVRRLAGTRGRRAVSADDCDLPVTRWRSHPPRLGLQGWFHLRWPTAFGRDRRATLHHGLQRQRRCDDELSGLPAGTQDD